MKNFTRILISSLSLVLVMAFNAHSQDVFKSAPVGIGTTTPQQALDVLGSVKFSGELMPNNNAGTTGNILTSNGTASPAWFANGTSGYVLGTASNVPSWVTPYVNVWLFSGNTGGSYGTNFLGTTNASGAPLEFKVNNTYAGVIDPTNFNVYFGLSGTGGDATALAASSTNNVAIGYATLATVGTGSSTGSNSYETAAGYYALHTNNNHGTTTASVGNTAIGYYAAEALTTGYPVTAFGYRADANATTGSFLTAFGYYSSGIGSPLTGTKDVTFGSYSDYELTSGSENTAAGYDALYYNTTGTYNTAVGYQSIYTGSTNTGIGNTAAGYISLYAITTGGYNIGIGYGGSHNTTTASNNIGIGYEANYASSTSGHNVAIGALAIEPNATNSSNVAIGTRAAYDINTLSPENTSYKPDVAIGDSALYNTAEGGQAVAVGYGAMRGFNTATVASFDVALGYETMFGYTTTYEPLYTTVIGALAYYRSTTALSYTTVIGAGAMESTTGGSEDVAIGAGAMGSTNTSYTNSGTYNIAIGSTNGIINTPSTSTLLAGSTLGNLSSGAENLAIGYNAGGATTTGGYNSYIGINAGSSSITGSYNTLIGANTNLAILGSNSYNTFIGDSANDYGSLATTADDYNTAIGADAIAGISPISTGSDYYNVAIGYEANASPVSPSSTQLSSGIAIGYKALSIASNAIAIGANAYANTNNTAILGSINGINGATSNVSVGIGTVTPAQALEIGGTSNTIRVDGLGTSGVSFYKTLTIKSNIVYVNSATGDFYSLPNGTSGQELIVNSSGVPTWGAPSFSMTATSPLSITTTPPVVPNVLLSGAIGSPVTGVGGTGSAFIGAGTVDSILGLNSSGNLAWINANAVGGPNDEWGSQVAETDSSTSGGHERTLTGNGVSPLRLAQQNANNNQTLVWNGTTWVPANVLTSIITKNITVGTALTITNPTNQVVGSANVNVDLQGTAGGIFVGNGAGVSATFTTVGTSGEVLTSTGTTAPNWAPLNVPAAWYTTGNSGIVSGANYLGTTDDHQMRIFVNNVPAGSIDPQLVGVTNYGNTYLGAPVSGTNSAGNNDVTGSSYNVGIGLGSMGFAASAATYNVALGMRSLQATSSMNSSYDVAIGVASMENNQTGGSYETAVGANTLGGISSSTAALYNTALGFDAMYGAQANSVYFGSYNTASGYKSLYTPTAGGGASNTALGSNSAYQSTGSKTVAIGDSALYSNTTGSYNTAMGYEANVSSGALSSTTALGAYSYSTQNNTITLGQISGTNGATSNIHVAIGTNNPKADAGLTIKTNHLETQGQLGAGNVFADAGSGTGSGGKDTVYSATDMGGSIAFTTGSSGLAAGAQITVFFATPYTYSPIISIAPGNNHAATAMTANGAYAGTGTSSFTIFFTTAPSANTTYKFNYFILETPGTLSSSIPCSVPIILSNTQSTATPTGFQEMLTVASSSYASMEMSGLQNVEFSTGANGGGTVLYSWIESGNSSSSASTIYWVNLATNTIPAQVGSTPGTLTIYMDFMPTSVMTGTTGVTGEAPQLSGLTTPTYGEYDNGSYVFGANASVPGDYDNFAGTILSSNWTEFTSGAGTLVVNNGLAITDGVTAGTQVITYNAPSSPSVMAETYSNGSAALTGNRSYMPGLTTITATAEGANIGDQNSSNYMDFSAGRNGVVVYAYSQGNSTSQFYDDVSAPSGYNVNGLGYTGSTNYWYMNYTNETNSNQYSPTGNVYLALGFGDYGSSGTSTINAYWARTRQYPPSTVMPTATYGSTICANSQPTEPNPCSVALTLTNNTSTATSTGFQQLVQINSSNYASLEMSGLQNVEFSTSPDGSGTPLEAWIESGNSSSAPNTVYWVNLGSNIIPANGTLMIYLDFMSSSVLSATGPTGEAPQLSSTYAQYDNGGIVFPNVYTIWGGLSGGNVPTTTGTGAINGGAISIYGTTGTDISITNNATNTTITYDDYPSYAVGVAYSTTPTSVTTFPTILESYVGMGGTYMWFGTGNGYEEGGTGAIVCWDGGFSNTDFGVKANSSGFTQVFTSPAVPVTPTASPIVWSLVMGSTNSLSVLDNYSQAISTTSGINNASPTYYGYFGTNQNLGSYGGNDQEIIYWTRTRTYPPSGTMPTVAEGSISCCPTPPGLTGLTGALTFCPGQTGVTYTVSAAAAGSGVTGYEWNVPTGATITSGQGTTSITVTYGISGGTVSVQATNSCGALGPASTLTVTPDFAIVSQPTNQSSTCATGSSAVFTVTTSGSISSYQWQVNSGSGWSNITTSGGGVYSGYTTNTLIVSAPPYTMNGYQYQCIVTGSCGGSQTSNAVTLTVLGSLPITITNNQSTATPTGFQQMITINNVTAGLTSQEMSGLQNVEFSMNPGGGSPLQAWIESGNSSTSTSTIFWVNLGSNTIPASGGTLTIYMDFMPTSVLSATGPTGEAPQLSGLTTPTYGEYDNGALVFTFYDGFPGTTLSSQWNSYISGTGTTVVNNGLTLTSAVTGGNMVNVISSNASFGAIVAETYASGNGAQGGSRSYMPAVISNTATVEGTTMSDDNEPSCPTTSYVSFSNGRAASQTYTWLQGWNCYVGGNNGADYNVYNPGSGAEPLSIWSIVYSNSTSINNSLLQNYSLLCNGTQAYNPTGNMYFALGVQDDGGNASTAISAYWARTRQYPPSATMPSTSLGSLGCCASPPSLGGISGSLTFCPNQTGVIYTVAPVAGVSSYTWSGPTGSTVTAGQGTTSATFTFGTLGGNISVTPVSSCGSTGAASTLAVTPSYGISTQPVTTSVSCASGSTATFTVVPSGTVTGYQWQVDSTGTWSNIISSRNGVYSGYTTGTLTITSPTISMNGFQYRCVVTGSCGGSVTSSAATLDVLGNVPITLTNSQTTATSSGFQQMVTINSSTYATQEMSGLQNVEFTVGGPAGTGTQLSSWIESGNTSSSTSTVYWVNLGTNIIPASGGTLIIYMNFMPTNILSAGPAPCAGEAPDISSTYAQYDNGGIVFPNVYTRWGGITGLPTTTATGAINGGAISLINTSGSSVQSVSVANDATYTQLNYTGNSGSWDGAYPDDIHGVYYTTTPPSSINYPTVLESKVNLGDTYSWFGTGLGQTEEGEGAVVANDNDNGGDDYYSVRSNFNLNSPGTYCAAGTISFGDYSSSLSEPNTTPYVWSLLLNNNSGTDQITNVMYNYTAFPGVTFPLTISGGGTTVSQSGSACGGLGTLFGYFGTAQNGSGNSEPYDQIYWTRTRTFPPAGVMPTVTPSGVTCCSAPGAPGTITSSPGTTSYCPGATATYSISAVAGASGYLWTFPTGSTITSGQGTTSVNVTLGGTAGNVAVATDNTCGEYGATSDYAVTPLYSISTQPANASVSCATGATATFSVTGTGITGYQWQVDSTGTWSNIISSRNGVYSGYTTATLTISAPPFSMNGYQYRVVITGTCGGTATSNAATLSVLGNIPITITNSQTTATPTNFSQMLTVNSSLYATQEMSGLQNVEFTVGGPAGTGTALQSWLESGNSSSSTSTVYWVNLGSNTIAASGGTLTIYMNFMPASVLSAAGPAGEAPQLSGTYAQYDNGTLVFTKFYDNFNGTSLASKWTVAPPAVVTVNDGVTINWASQSNWFGIYTNTFSSALGNVAESYLEASNPNQTGACINTSGTNGNGINNGTDGVDAQLDGPSGTGIAFGTGGSCTSYPNANVNPSTATPLANTFYVMSFYMLNTPVMQLNYGAFESVTGTGTTLNAISATSEVGLGVAQNSSGTYQWFRVRANAPNSVMPSATYYSLTCCQTPPATGTITGSTSTFCPGSTGTYSISAVAGASSYVWTVPTGSTITSGQGTTSINVTFGSTTGNVTVAATNSCGEQGTASTYGVSALFSITGPSNASVTCAGGNATFTVTAVGATSYQWQVSTNGGGSWTTLTNTAPYSNVTTATLTITSPTSGMNNYEYECVVTSSSCSGATSAVGTLTVSSLNSVKITITNSQTTATPTNFQQMLTINFTGYGSASPALLSNLSNVEFTTGPAGTGTPLYAWFENSSTTTPATAPSSSSSAAIVWVNLGSDIIAASGGSINIYMTFMPSVVMGVPTGATAYTGEAPELTGTYGQYDNGALVFNSLYDNFAGPTLSSIWSNYSAEVGSTVPTLTVSSGLTISVPAIGNPGGNLYSADVMTSVNSYSPNIIAEMYASGSSSAAGSMRSYMPGLISNTATAEGLLIADENYPNPPNNSYLCFSNGRAAIPEYAYLQGIPGYEGSCGCGADYDSYDGTYGGSEAYTVIGLVYSPTSNNLYFNYSLATTSGTVASFSPTSNMYFAIGDENQQCSSNNANTLNSYWARLRNYPPNNTMPSVVVNAYSCY